MHAYWSVHIVARLSYPSLRKLTRHAHFIGANAPTIDRWRIKAAISLLRVQNNEYCDSSQRGKP